MVPEEVVFDAVVAVVGEVGPTQLTLARIGAHAGLTAGALVQRFGSKAGLLDAFAAASVEDVHERFAAAHRARPDDPVAAAVDALVALSVSLGDRRAFANHLAWFAVELADTDLRRHAVAHAASVQRALARLLGDAALARHLRAVYQGALVLWALEPAGSRTPLARFVRRELEAAVAPYAGG